MESNERPPEGGGVDGRYCMSRSCINRHRRKRRRLFEPDDENSNEGEFVDCDCNRISELALDIPPDDSSGDEEFSDDEAVINFLTAERQPPTQAISEAGGLSTNAETMSSTSAALQSPTTGSGTLAAPGPTGSSVARVQDFCWQESRSTVAKRAGYLLNNSRMSDIRFLVGESKTEIHAHKTILALGSPVFEAQFFGSVGSGGGDVVELPDMDPETFLLFLKYIYTDELESSLYDCQLLSLLRPAKKYIVPHLVDKCSDILMTELKPENIFQILHHANFYQLKKLEGACERYIDRNSGAIVQSEEFSTLEISILTEFLKRDSLNIKEETLFKAVLKWATAECQRTAQVPNFENLRAVLGDCLKLIRFPTMTKEEFASTFETTNILSPEEACSVFVYMCKSSPNPPAPSPALLVFPTKKRTFSPQLCAVSRFGGPPMEHCLNYRSGEIYNYRINFKVDRPVYMKGANIFSIRCGAQLVYSGTRRDFSAAMYLYEKGAPSPTYLGRKQFNRYGSLEPDPPGPDDGPLPIGLTPRDRRLYFPVYFPEEIPIPAGKTFTLCVVVSVNSQSYPSQPLQTYVGTNERSRTTVLYSEDLPINFAFSSSSGDGSVGKFTSAQIPEILFCL